MSKNIKFFINQQIDNIRSTVGDNIAITALSGGVDSSVCTVLAHKALGNRLKTIFVDNALMREGEPQEVVSTFKKLNIHVEIIDARQKFLDNLKGLTDPEEKRNAITKTFYQDVFAQIVHESGAKFVIHGTILTDIEETVSGIKRQHNILMQLGIDPEKEYGYKVIEPLKELRKDEVRKVADALRLPKQIVNRMPFPGPALSARIVGEVNEEKLSIVRKATQIVEKELKYTKAFQYFAVLLNDKATGIRNNKREFGYIIVIRCIESKDARKAKASRLPWDKLEKICELITNIPGVNRCLYDLTPKPPATIEYV